MLSGVSLLLIGLSTLIGGENPVYLFFGLYIIFFQRRQELPSKDDITGVDDNSQLLAAIAATAMLLVILPFPVTSAAVDAASSAASGFF